MSSRVVSFDLELEASAAPTFAVSPLRQEPEPLPEPITEREIQPVITLAAPLEAVLSTLTALERNPLPLAIAADVLIAAAWTAAFYWLAGWLWG